MQAQGLMRSDLTQAHLQFVLGHRTVVSVTVRMWRCERSFCHVVKLKLEGPGCNRTFCLFSSWKKLGGRGFMLWMKSWRDSGWTFAHIFLCLVQTWLILSRELGRSRLVLRVALITNNKYRIKLAGKHGCSFKITKIRKQLNVFVTPPGWAQCPSVGSTKVNTLLFVYNDTPPGRLRCTTTW